jgi:hypothetical protein
MLERVRGGRITSYNQRYIVILGRVQDQISGLGVANQCKHTVPGEVKSEDIETEMRRRLLWNDRG